MVRARVEAEAQRQGVHLPKGWVQEALPQRVGHGPRVEGFGEPGSGAQQH